MVEVHNEDPSRGKAGTVHSRDGEHELPTSKWGAASEQPHATPKPPNKEQMLGSTWEPLGPEIRVALSTWALRGEVEEPQTHEQRPCVVGSKEMPRDNQRHCKPAVFVWPIQPIRGVPSKPAVDQEIDSTRVMLHVFHDNICPRQTEEVRPTMRDVVLPPIWWESGTMEHVMKNVHVLDAKLPKRDTNESCRKPEWYSLTVIEHYCINDRAQALTDEYCSVPLPHVHHLLRCDFAKHESKILRHDQAC